MKFQDLDLKAKNVASRYKACEKELLQIIAEVDQKKAFLHWGYNSLFAYVTKGLGLTSSVACNFIAVARKSHEVPALKEQVLTGKMSVYQARKITPVLNTENQEQWLEKARTQSQKQLEREVALANPKTAVIEKSTYIPLDREITEKVKILQKVPRVQLQMGVSEKIMIQLRRAQALEGQKKRHRGAPSLEDTLEVLLETYLKKNDPVEKAKRQQMRGKLVDQGEASKPSSHRSHENDADSLPQANRVCKTSQKGKSSRKALPARVRHQVQLRDGGRCTYKDQNGHRCSVQRHLEVHHRKPVSKGGGDELSNLTLFCSGHHRSHHLRFGF